MVNADKYLLNIFIAFRVPKVPKDKQETEEKRESEETLWVLRKLIIVLFTVWIKNDLYNWYLIPELIWLIIE